MPVQVWVPGFTPDGLIVLSCKGAPYAIAGEGDLCALFHCVSCRHVFYPSSPDTKARGSIGRVFQSHQVRVTPSCTTLRPLPPLLAARHKRAVLRSRPPALSALSCRDRTPPQLTPLPPCVQPEVCANISGAPSAVFHRAVAARQCMLHSLCVLPLWVPAISRRAPVAVLEVLQPDPQPDFDLLCKQARPPLRMLIIALMFICSQC
jgi:hypothetical protein